MNSEHKLPSWVNSKQREEASLKMKLSKNLVHKILYLLHGLVLGDQLMKTLK